MNTQSLIEQRLIEDLWVESIQMTGTDAFYIPRQDENTDLVYGEDPLKYFTTNFPIEVYNSDTTNFEGQKEMFSKFGLEIHNDYTILLSRKTFKQRVKQNPLYDRPREGDLIYIRHVSRGGTLFEITWVEPDADFFTLGRKLPYYYKMKLEPFKYSNEVLLTGIQEVDSIPGQDGYTVSLQLYNGTGNYQIGEYAYQGASSLLSTQKGIVSHWDPQNMVLTLSNIVGAYENDVNIVGSITGASYSILYYDPMQDNSNGDTMNNNLITEEGVDYIDMSEANPLNSGKFNYQAGSINNTIATNLGQVAFNVSDIPTIQPTTVGTIWNNGGILSITGFGVGLTMQQIPTIEPVFSGQLWNNNGILNITGFAQTVDATQIPTSQPTISNVLWNNGGILCVS